MASESESESNLSWTTISKAKFAIMNMPDHLPNKKELADYSGCTLGSSQGYKAKVAFYRAARPVEELVKNSEIPGLVLQADKFPSKDDVKTLLTKSSLTASAAETLYEYARRSLGVSQGLGTHAVGLVSEQGSSTP
ncbi:hypothetical protein PsYK624_107590 [Phanerochaete sordida]|uniref:Uncharacterized protein n=1 Tax=Phanerochaete sordida TaxID=48140 RepID=A0A9P3GHV9_9APHY|nr:hypothetical protein PsYK624_107590 [Phanerochaete sordida]